MDGFLALAGQLFLVLCIQWVLEAMASRWQNSFMLKPIELGCYLAKYVRAGNKYLHDTHALLEKMGIGIIHRYTGLEDDDVLQKPAGLLVAMNMLVAISAAVVAAIILF